MAGWQAVGDEWETITGGDDEWETVSAPSNQTPTRRRAQLKEFGPYMTELTTNIPGSAWRQVEPFLHPIETGKGMVYAVAGMIERMRPGDEASKPHGPYFDAVVEELKSRYGGLENIKNTLRDDPIGIAGDIAAALTTVGAGLKLSGEAAGIGRMATAGRGIETAGLMSDPLSIIGKVGSGTTRAVTPVPATVLEEVLGTTTGVGGEAVRVAKEGMPEFGRALRGGTSWEEIVDGFRGALQDLRRTRGQAYRSQLEEIARQNPPVSMQPVVQELNSMLNEFNVRPSWRGGQLQLDFSKSRLSKQGQGAVTEATNYVMDWYSDPTMQNAVGMDTLKQKLDDIMPEGSNAEVFVKGIREVVRGELETSVPGYREMTSEYRKATEFIKEVEAELGLGPKKNPGSIIQKLVNMFNQRSDYRTLMVDSIDQYVPQNLKAQVAGHLMNQWTPVGIMRPLTGGGILFGMQAGVTPGASLALLSTSPRIVGEAMYALSRLRRASEAASLYMPPPSVVTRPAVYGRDSELMQLTAPPQEERPTVQVVPR